MDSYAKLLELLDGHGARYRLIDHPPEGRTEVVSAFRGHPPSLAAKCLLLMVKIGKKDLELLADPAVLANGEIFFNAARLDRSMALSTADWTAVAKPRVERIAG
jgi:Ala-tRNA(Pro) deacylase